MVVYRKLIFLAVASFFLPTSSGLGSDDLDNSILSSANVADFQSVKLQLTNNLDSKSTSLIPQKVVAPALTTLRDFDTQLKLGVGDLLKIKVYKREDLSGEYRVQADNRLSLPLIAPLSVKGMNAAELERTILSIYQTASVNVEVVEWRPFHIVGIVESPGKYIYLPNLTVAHAIALAGGLRRVNGENTGLYINKSRELRAIEAADDRLQKALTRLARLEAERDGLTDFEAPRDLLRIVSGNRADELVSKEKLIFVQRQNTLDRKAKAFAHRIKLIQEEIEEYKGQIKQTKERQRVAALQLKSTELLSKRGLVRLPNLYSGQRDVSRLISEERQILIEYSKAKRLLSETKNTWENYLDERDLAIKEAIVEIKQQINDDRRTIQLSKEIVVQINEATRSVPESITGNFDQVTYSIVRLNDDAYTTIPANTHTWLIPGDLLEVKVAQDDAKEH